jgi:aspartate/methionine/tyrosine aminotransferase
MPFAERIHAIEPFLAVEIAERAQALERAGADIVHLEFGEPDFEAPAVVREAAEKALKDGRTKYVSSLGILPLREAIAEHYRRSYGVALSPEQILVTPGTSPAMLLLFGHLVDPGDEVILSDPHYACYPNFIRYASGIPAYVPILEQERFQYRPEEIARRLGPRTKAILVNSPANPTGAVLAVDRLEAIARHAEEHGVVVVSDEIYHGLNYGGRDHSILEFTERAFVLNGFSKAFAMTGWRLGYAIGPRANIRALQTLYGNFFIATNEFVQWAGLAALTEGAAESERYRAIFDDRRRAMIAGLRAIGLGVGFEPTGAFYVLANARHHAADSTRLAIDILESCHVAVTPGAAFGPGGEGYLRFSYASSVERIAEGLRRIGRFLAERGPGGRGAEEGPAR